MKRNFLNLSIISLLIMCACEGNVPSYSIHTDLQNNYLIDNYASYSGYVNGQSDLSNPLPFSVDLKDVEIGSTITTYKGNKEIDSFTYTNKQETYDIYNLEIGSTYKTEITTSIGIIKTIDYKIEDVAPRNLYIDGVTNCRDLGGWKIDKKSRVKQGMIFRTAKYNEDESTELLISEKGIDTLKNQLKVKTEIDLRKTADNENGGLTSSPLGPEVEYISYPMVSSGNVLTLNKSRLNGIFAIFADETKYPITFHCSIGTDRTGLIAFLINGLLGVGKEDLCRDYLFSNFGMIYNMRTAKTVEEYLETIELSSGTSLHEKFYNFLESSGVSTEYLDKIRSIMIEK